MAKSKSARKPTRSSRSSSDAAPPAPPTAPPAAATEVRAELVQLADLRAAFAALSADAAAAFHALHDDDACRARGTNTRSGDTFRIGMTWARTFGAHAADPGIKPVQVRWFLDCLGALGMAMTGRAPTDNPAHGSARDDAHHAADKLLRRTERRARDATGSNRALTAALDAALTADGVIDARVSRLRQLATLLEGWLAPKSSHATALGLFDLDAATVAALRSAADRLDALLATAPAPQQIDRDSTAVNVAEGRLFFAMRPLWDGLADAREDGVSSLLLTVSPALLRGLNLKPQRKPATTPA